MVDAPSPTPAVPVEGAGAAGLSAAVAPAVLGCMLGWVLAGCVLAGWLAPSGLENSEGPGAGAEAAVPGALAAVDLAPRLGNKPPLDGAAGVDEGVEEVAPPPPRAGKSDLAGVLDVAGVEEAGVLVVAAPAGGVENNDEAGFCSPAGAAGALPNRGLELASLVVGAGSAGLPSPGNKPPPGAEGVEPSEGFCCVFDPKRPPPAPAPPPAPDSGFDAAPNNVGVVELVADGAADEAGAPKRPPGFCPACPA